MKFTKFKTKINDVDTNIIVASTVQAKTKAVKQPVTHYILLIDRSGSMSYELNGLLDQVNDTIDHIGSQNYLTIIWYSGANQHDIVVKAAKANSDIKDIINKMRYTVGTTCFSQPLQLANTLVSDKNIVVDQTSLILFTDGQPVVGWTVSEEERRSQEAVNEMVKNGLSSMTCIGYGNYYNRKFLIELADLTDHGQIMHNSRIDEFLESFKNTIGAASDLIRKPLSISASADLDITYLTDRAAQQYTHTKTINLDSISAHRNDFYISVPDVNSNIDISEDSENTSVSMGEIKGRTSAAAQLDFFYGLASKYYYYGKRKEALDIIVKNAKDKHIADKMMAAFTNSEVADVQKLMDEAVFDRSTRYLDGKCKEDYLPQKDALCVMDIFNVLFGNESGTYYIPFSKNVEKYSRIGKKVEDQQNAFTRSDEEVRMPLSELKWNKDKLNLNVLFSIKGTVKLNARAAKTYNLPVDFPAKIYNTHTFVKDGILNVSKAEFLMDGDTVDKLVRLMSKAKNDCLKPIPIPSGVDNLYRFVVDFTGLPIINQTYIDEANDIGVIYDLVKENVSLEASLKVVKAEIDTLKTDSTDLEADGVFTGLTPDQVRVLSEHGISDKGVYNGIDNKVVDGEKDSYEIRLLDFSIAGFKTLPSVNDFRKMLVSTKPVTSGPGNLMVGYYKTLQEKVASISDDNDKKNILLGERKSIENKLSTNRQKISLVKLSKILNNDFFENLSKDDKGNLFFEKDLKMNIKSERKLQTI